MRPSFFQRRKLQNFIDGFLLRAVDKAAGVHDCNVRKRSVIAQLKARVFQVRHQHFAVHLVFGTAKADHSHFNCHVYNPFSVHIQALDMPLYNFCSAATYFSRKRAAFQSKCRPFTKIIQLYAQKHACRPEIMPFLHTLSVSRNAQNGPATKAAPFYGHSSEFKTEKISSKP